VYYNPFIFVNPLNYPQEKLLIFLRLCVRITKSAHSSIGRAAPFFSQRLIRLGRKGEGYNIMSYIYVLKSSKNGKRYIGSTDLQPEERLKKHNYGSNKFTKRNSPFKIVHQESYPNKTEARKRENFLKSGVGRKYLDEILK
jgi:putative endonuclease